MSRFDWPALMRAGMSGLGLKPAEFWALTPAEFALLLGKAGGQVPLTRDRLQQLERAYPGKKQEAKDGK